MIAQTIAVLGLFNAGVYWVAVKWGLIEWMQLHVPEWAFPSNCQLCFFHRVTFLQVLFYNIFIRDFNSLSEMILYYVVLPLAAAALSRFIVNP